MNEDGFFLKEAGERQASASITGKSGSWRSKVTRKAALPEGAQHILRSFGVDRHLRRWEP